MSLVTALGTLPNNQVYHVYSIGPSREHPLHEYEKGAPVVQPFIVGGQNTSICNYPWLVQFFATTPTKFLMACGGSIIHHRYILTAAHCCENIPISYMRIVVGQTKPITRKPELFFDQEPCNIRPQIIEIEETIVHPWREINSVYDDIALVRLKESIQFNEILQPVCLPTDDKQLEKGTKLITMGWGFTEHGTVSPAQDLQNIPVVAHSYKHCKELLKSYNILQRPNFICTKGNYQKSIIGPDRGDSGGPLIKEQKENNCTVQVGIVSFSITEGPNKKERKTNFYIKVSYYKDWIQKQLKS